jgi:hypothetical protein
MNIDRNHNPRDSFLASIHTPAQGALALTIALWGNDLSEPSWHAEAACAGTGESPWFADNLSKEIGNWRSAVCARCPVKRQCARDCFEWEHRSPFSSPQRFGYRHGIAAADRTALAHLARRHQKAS